MDAPDAGGADGVDNVAHRPDAVGDITQGLRAPIRDGYVHCHFHALCSSLILSGVRGIYKICSRGTQQQRTGNERDGIPVSPEHHESLKDIAAELGVELPFGPYEQTRF